GQDAWQGVPSVVISHSVAASGTVQKKSPAGSRAKSQHKIGSAPATTDAAAGNGRQPQTAATTHISTSTSGRYIRASTQARAGAAPSATQASYSALSPS